MPGFGSLLVRWPDEVGHFLIDITIWHFPFASFNSCSSQSNIKVVNLYSYVWNSERRFFSCLSNPPHREAAIARLVDVTGLLAFNSLSFSEHPQAVISFWNFQTLLKFHLWSVLEVCWLGCHLTLVKVSFWNLFSFICSILNFDHRELIYS